MVGDPDTPEGLAFLQSRSPLHRAEKIRRPLLIGQGGNDPRVKQAEADQMVEAMKANGIPVVYALYPDEGHGFARPANALSFSILTEAFLSQHLGGAYDPPAPGETDGTSLHLVESEAWVAAAGFGADAAPDERSPMSESRTEAIKP